MDRFDKVNGSIQGHRKIVPVVAGKGKGAVGQGKGDSAMNDPKTIHHFLPYRHLDAAITFANLQYFDAQPLAEPVVEHHVGDD